LEFTAWAAISADSEVASPAAARLRRTRRGGIDGLLGDFDGVNCRLGGLVGRRRCSFSRDDGTRGGRGETFGGNRRWFRRSPGFGEVRCRRLLRRVSDLIAVPHCSPRRPVRVSDRELKVGEGAKHLIHELVYGFAHWVLGDHPGRPPAAPEIF
jgi:hypothetical protein